MARATVTEDAGRELRDRMAGHGTAGGIMIVPGPAHEHYQGVEWTADDEIIAPIQRWVLLTVPLSSFDPLLQACPNEFSVFEVDGFKVGVFLAPKVALRVELEDDAVRVREIDA